MLYALSYLTDTDTLISAEGKELVKFGYTEKWETRLAAYRSYLPHPIIVFGLWEGSWEEEQEFLKENVSASYGGEWLIYDEIKDKLPACCNSPEIHAKTRCFTYRTVEPKTYSKRGRKLTPAVEKTVQWLESKLEKGSSVEFDDLMNELGFSDKDRTTVKNSLRPSALAKKGLGITLNELGVTIQSKGGRAAYFRLSKQ